MIEEGKPANPGAGVGAGRLDGGREDPVLRKLFRTYEGGQALVLVALLVPVLLGMAGMAVDLGNYASDRRGLQNAADSIALAAARDLPNAGQAEVAAHQWADKNGIDWNRVTLDISGGTTAPKVSVTIAKPHDFVFARLVGITSKDVSAHAAAIKASYGGGSGVVPWSVLQSTVDAAANGSVVTLKYDSNGVNTGNFGPIQIDGSGSSTYKSSVMYGSNSAVCSVGQADCTTAACPGTYPGTCAETAPSCDGPECQPQTGNMTGNTRTAVDFRINNTSASCDTFDEAFPTDSNGDYYLSPNCNPWNSGPGSCPTATSLCSRRVMIIPVIDSFGNGSSDPIEIQSFALVFLEGYNGGSCTGSSCEIQARFVKTELTANGLAGVYDPNALIQFVKLVE